MELILFFELVYAFYLANVDKIHLSKFFKILLLTTITIPIIGAIMFFVFQYKIFIGILDRYYEEEDYLI